MESFWKTDPLSPWHVDHWPLKWRRAFLIALPVTAPLWIVTMAPVLLATVAVEIGFDCYCRLRELWG